jgi:hypothetical protein
MAFSVNSVGHMVKSGKLANAMAALHDLLGIEEISSTSKIDSLEKALELAMRTIARASEAPSGKATELLSTEDAPCPDLPCPIDLPSSIKHASYCQYRGYYHTDVTVPSDYFRPGIERPASAPEHRLDFTYLFDKRIANPDFITMGEGVRIRAIQPEGRGDDTHLILSEVTEKVLRARGQEIPISASRRLQEAIAGKY